MEEKYTGLVGSIFAVLVLPNIRGSIRKHYPGIFGLRILQSFALSAKLTHKIWKRDAIDAVWDPQFFVIPIEQLFIHKEVLESALFYDQERLEEFIGNDQTYARQSFHIHIFT